MGGTIKKYQCQVRDAQVKVDDESHMKSIAQDAKVASERKAGSMQNALEEGRTMLEQADRGRRSLEQELADSNEALADLSNQNQAILAAKRKLENELSTLTADLDEMAAEAKLSEDKAGRAMIDAARLADELRAELDVESRRYADTSKNLRKTERKIKELAFASDEDKKNHERMQALIDQLQGKVKSYKKQ